jgi:hypothetical protein
LSLSRDGNILINLAAFKLLISMYCGGAGVKITESAPLVKGVSPQFLLNY